MKESRSGVTGVCTMLSTDEPTYRHVSPVLLNAADLKVPVLYDAVLHMFVSESVQITDAI